MSAQISQDDKWSGFKDAVRAEAVATIYGYWAEFHEAIGIERAADLTVERIKSKNSRIARLGLPDEMRWHYSIAPKVLTVRRRIEEAAKADRYAPEHPPLRCVGMKPYQGQRESQYQPFDA